MSSFRGHEYEQYINKLFKGEDVSRQVSYCDIETKKYLYEVKGVMLYHEHNNNNCVSLGRYYIRIEEHKTLQIEALNKKKKAKYCFVLKIGQRYIFRTINWITVEKLLQKTTKSCIRKTGECVKFIRLQDIW